MKILTTSDWHLGNLFHGNDRLPEHHDFLSWLLKQIEEQQPDALLVAGDVFDNGNPSAAAQSAYYEFLANATQKCQHMQIIITAGNHDSASRLEAPRPLLTRYHVEIRGNIGKTWVQNEEGGYWQIDYDDLMIPITGNNGDKAVVLAVPYLRNDILQNASYSKGVNNFLRTLTAKAREKHPGLPLVMMAHMYAKGADIAKYDASEKIIIGGQEEVNMEGWTDHPDYLTCGHIHKRQHIWNTDWARYTGSILPMSFAEKDYTHGIDVVTLHEGIKPKVQHLVYQPQHKLVVLPEKDEELTPKKLKKLINDHLKERVNGKLGEDFDYVTLKVKLEKISNDEIKALEDLVNAKNAVLCRIQKIIPQLDFKTISGKQSLKSIDDIINRNPMDTLREAFYIKHNVNMNEQQETMLSDIISAIKNEAND